jgi:hypothetical protein
LAAKQHGNAGTGSAYIADVYAKMLLTGCDGAQPLLQFFLG